MTLSGKVGDAMYGVKHMMADETAYCEACVMKVRNMRALWRTRRIR